MKITIDVPDWAIKEKRAIYILAGIECVGYKLPWQDHWNIKEQRCSSCGLCCKKMNCKKLIDEPGDNDLYRCKDGIMRPFLCCTSEPKSIIECTSKYKVVR